MALFNRVNLNTLSLINHCYCKFTTSTVKLKANKHVSVSSNLLYEVLNKQKEAKTSIYIKRTPFEVEIAKRRDEACRSILVQVYSANSTEDLQSYCSKFGTILNMHHYQTERQRHYILIEFEDKESVKQIMSYAAFMNSDLIIPVKSSVLWFRKGQMARGPQNIPKKVGLSRENSDLYPSTKQITNILYHSKSISGQILHLYDVLKLNELETRLRFHTAHHLEQYFSGLFCRMQVLLFGSSINGFGGKRCDLDLVLVPDETKESDTNNRLVFHSKSMKIQDRYGTKEFLGILANTMQYFIPGIENVRRILEARVPIIKFNFEYSHLECDLSVTNMAAVYMSELLNLYGEIDWRVRPLVLIIRKWAKIQEITCDSPGPWITNFSLSLLVLFYLQQKSILPSLRMLKIYATKDDVRHTENGIDCTFLRDIHKLPNEYKYKSNQEDLEVLLLGFLEYYSIFDFYTKGICIREGMPIRKPSRSALHIVNPLETTLNVSKNVSIFELNRLTQKAHDAIFLMETSDKSKHVWGLMNLLKMNNLVNIQRLNVAECSNVEKNDPQENHSHEISETIVNNEDVQPKKKEETV